MHELEGVCHNAECSGTHLPRSCITFHRTRRTPSWLSHLYNGYNLSYKKCVQHSLSCVYIYMLSSLQAFSSMLWQVSSSITNLARSHEHSLLHHNHNQSTHGSHTSGLFLENLHLCPSLFIKCELFLLKHKNHSIAVKTWFIPFEDWSKLTWLSISSKHINLHVLFCVTFHSPARLQKCHEEKLIWKSLMI